MLHEGYNFVLETLRDNTNDVLVEEWKFQRFMQGMVADFLVQNKGVDYNALKATLFEFKVLSDVFIVGMLSDLEREATQLFEGKFLVDESSEEEA